ncbi:MAG TPA: GGDEF domain-containing protein [Gaiellaceae bacterium]
MDTRPLRSEGGAGGNAPAAAEGQRRRLVPLLAPVIAAGAATVAAALTMLVVDRPSGGTLAGIALLLAAATLAEAYPVPIESLPGGFVSLAAVFVVATGLMYGWAPAAIVALLTRVALEILQRRPAVRLAYNGAVYALCGAACGLVELLVPSHSSIGALMVAVLLGAAAFWIGNVLLIAAVVARWSGEDFRGVVRGMVYWTSIPFAIMASVSLMLVVLWERSPVAIVALVGPLVAIVLYQRSTYKTLEATRLALTDPLTGLGNRRHFHERLETDLDRAEREGGSVALCVIDVDDFKRVNDELGHDAGDEVLVAVARHLRGGGESFRLGGDEFAVVLPGHSQRSAMKIARSIVARIAYAGVTVSAGVATFPKTERNELHRTADQALYRAKDGGKNAVAA